jgi:hypothetical protein
MNEEAATQDYLVGLLSADAELGGYVNAIWTRSMPGMAPLSFVKVERLDATDLYVVNLSRVWSDLTYLIRGIVKWPSNDPQDWSTVRAISDRIDALLHKHEGVNSEIQVHAFREEPFTDETLEGGDVFLHAGGIYRVRAHAL